MRDLSDLVHVAACTAAAAQRRVDGQPRDPSLAVADLGPVQARLDDLAATAHTTAAYSRAVIAAGLDRIRCAAARCERAAAARVRPGFPSDATAEALAADREFEEAEREAATVARSTGYELRAIVAESRALRLLRDQLAAELAEGRRRVPSTPSTTSTLAPITDASTLVPITMPV